MIRVFGHYSITFSSVIFRPQIFHLRSLSVFTNSWTTRQTVDRVGSQQQPVLNGSQLLITNKLLTESTRSSTSFFNKVSAEHLWKSVTSVSNAGRKRGRGRGTGKRIPKDLNRGQIIGQGKANIQWPGLNAPIIRGKEVVQMQQFPPDPDRESKLIKIRDSMGKLKPLRLNALERGWCGSRMGGRKLGPPDPVGKDVFEGFETVCLGMKTVARKDGRLGTVRSFNCLAFTGNKNGLVGVGIGRSKDGRTAVARAKNRAGQRLIYIERFNNHTTLHDFFCRFGRTRIFVYQKYEGYGLKCHRAIKSMCELIGIKDLHAKIEGPKNMIHIIRAFMLGLLRQKTHDELAQSKQLFLVEQRKEQEMFPTVLGVPQEVRRASQVDYSETLDFSHVGFDNRVPLPRKKYQPFYMNDGVGWEYHLLRTAHRRNFPQVKARLLAEYGGVKQHPKSHLVKQYPECDSWYPVLLHRKKIAEAKNRVEEEEE